MIHDLSTNPSILNRFVAEIRDENVQRDSLRFRRNMERIGEVMACEISKTLDYGEQEIVSPLGMAKTKMCTDKIVIATILRAGLPFHQGFLNYFDNAESGFISAFRKYDKGGEFEIQVEYLSAPDLADKTLIIVDPMIATGSSMWLCYKSLLAKGAPAKIHVAAAISSEQGLTALRLKMPAETTIWSAAVDKELTAQAYIVPGLGDAGDLAYGKKD